MKKTTFQFHLSTLIVLILTVGCVSCTHVMADPVGSAVRYEGEPIRYYMWAFLLIVYALIIGSITAFWEYSERQQRTGHNWKRKRTRSGRIVPVEDDTESENDRSK